MLSGLDLFSGIGGMSIGLKDYVIPIAYCEQDEYCQQVLTSRIIERKIPRAPIWSDVRTFPTRGLPKIDIIYGGFPCQDISIAGHGKGLGGERSWLFREIVRLAQEIKPKFIFLENVPAIRTRGLNHVAEWISELRYDCRWDIISAKEVGFPHERKRWFMLAHAHGSKLRKPKQVWQKETLIKYFMENGKTSNATCEGLEGSFWEKSGLAFDRRLLGGCPWEEYASFFYRMDNGVSNRVDRLKSLGNSCVPRQAEKAFKTLMGLYD